MKISVTMDILNIAIDLAFVQPSFWFAGEGLQKSCENQFGLNTFKLHGSNPLDLEGAEGEGLTLLCFCYAL